MKEDDIGRKFDGYEFDGYKYDGYKYDGYESDGYEFDGYGQCSQLKPYRIKADYGDDNCTN